MCAHVQLSLPIPHKNGRYCRNAALSWLISLSEGACLGLCHIRRQSRWPMTFTISDTGFTPQTQSKTFLLTAVTHPHWSITQPQFCSVNEQFLSAHRTHHHVCLSTPTHTCSKLYLRTESRLAVPWMLNTSSICISEVQVCSYIYMIPPKWYVNIRKYTNLDVHIFLPEDSTLWCLEFQCCEKEVIIRLKLKCTHCTVLACKDLLNGCFLFPCYRLVNAGYCLRNCRKVSRHYLLCQPWTHLRHLGTTFLICWSYIQQSSSVGPYTSAALNPARSKHTLLLVIGILVIKRAWWIKLSQ